MQSSALLNPIAKNIGIVLKQTLFAAKTSLEEFSVVCPYAIAGSRARICPLYLQAS